MSDVNVWNKSNLKGKMKYRFFPTDMMLRALFSDDYFESENLKEKGVVLDIGCLYANNLVPFYERQWECFGTEVTQESVEISKQSCSQQNINADIRLGYNSKLPFENDTFDVLLSIATLHYEESLENVKAALKEFNRVLKTGGCALIQTVAPKHTFFLKSNRLSEHLYQLDLESDLRHKQVFSFWESSSEFEEIAIKFFSSIEVARCTEEYPNKTVDVWLFKLVK